MSSSRILDSSISIQLLVSNEGEEVLTRWSQEVDKLLSLHKCQISMVVRPADFCERLANADIAVVSGGLTVFQALSMGIPVVGLPQYVHQNDTLQNLY